MKFNYVILSVILHQYFQIAICSPLSNGGEVRDVDASKTHLIDPIKFVPKSLERDNHKAENVTSTTTTHSPGLRSLSHAEPDMNEVDSDHWSQAKSERNPYKNVKNPEHDLESEHKDSNASTPHSRSKRGIIFFAIKKLFKLKFLLLG